jgi:hypothetical protein
MISIYNLQKHIVAGEDSARQFKADVRNAESLNFTISTNKMDDKHGADGLLGINF